MKKIILASLIAILLVPGVSSAYTPLDTSAIDVSQYTSPESLEELRILLMKQIIVLLQLRIQELIALRDGTVPAPSVLGIATSTDTTAETTTRTRSGGGGGSSSSRNTQSQINDLQNTVNELLAELDELQAEQTEIEALKAEIETLQTELNQRDADIVSYQEQVQQLTGDIDELESAGVEKEQRIQELELLNQVLTDTLASRAAEISELEAKISELETKRDELQETISTLTQTIAELEAEKTLLTEQLSTAESLAGDRNAQIQNLTEELIALQAEQVEANNAHTASTTALESEIAEKETQIELLTAQIADLSELADIDTEYIIELEDTILDLEADKLALEESVEALINLYATDVTALQNAISEREATIALLEQDLDELRASTTARINELDADIAFLSNEVIEWQALAEAQLATLQEALDLLDNFSAQITDLESLVESLLVQIAILEGENEDLEEVISGPPVDCILESASISTGATLVFCTSTDPVVVGETLSILVGIDSGLTEINAVEAELFFDPNVLSVTGINVSQSDFSLRTSEPSYSNSTGQIDFGFGSPEPLSGISTLMAIHFTAKASGTTTFGVAASALESDGLGTDSYQDSDYPVYTIGQAPYDATLEFSASANNPDATTIIVNENDNTNNVVILVADLFAEDGPIAIDKLAIRVDTPDGIASDIVGDSEIQINGQAFNVDERLLIGGDQGAEYHVFNDISVLLAGDATIDFEFSVDIEPIEDNYTLPQFIQAAVDLETRSLWEAEGFDNLNPETDYFGTAIGEIHTLMGPGVLVEVTDTSVESVEFDTGGSIGIFEINLDLTAIEDDFYFTDNSGISPITNGLQFRIDGPGNPTNLTSVVSSTADEEQSGVFVIPDGETENVTLEVTFKVSEAGAYRVVLEDLLFTNNFNGTTDTRSSVVLNSTDARTDYVILIPLVD